MAKITKSSATLLVVGLIIGAVAGGAVTYLAVVPSAEPTFNYWECSIGHMVFTAPPERSVEEGILHSKASHIMPYNGSLGEGSLSAITEAFVNLEAGEGTMQAHPWTVTIPDGKGGVLGTVTGIGRDLKIRTYVLGDKTVWVISGEFSSTEGTGAFEGVEIEGRVYVLVTFFPTETGLTPYMVRVKLGTMTGWP